MSHDPFNRPNPTIWHDEEAASGVFIGDPDPLTLLDMPTSMTRKGEARLPLDYVATPEVVAFVEGLQAALRAAVTDPAPRRFALDAFGALDRAAVADMLGEGEVTIVAGRDPLFQVQESVLCGVWRVRSETAEGAVTEFVEIGDVPGLVREIARADASFMPVVPPNVPGAMNAPAVLAEIRSRAAGYVQGQPNHVVNFTLLPLTPEDSELITAALGQAPLTIVSGGYGTCRIMATAVKNVWAVQYMNASGATILDTVEIGDVPDAARAAAVDFEDSAERLGEILVSYLS